MDNTEVKKKGGRPKSRSEIKKRVGLAVYPSVYERVSQMAYVEKLSINEMMCRMISEYLTVHADKLKMYQTLKEEEERLQQNQN